MFHCVGKECHCISLINSQYNYIVIEAQTYNTHYTTWTPRTNLFLPVPLSVPDTSHLEASHASPGEPLSVTMTTARCITTGPRWGRILGQETPYITGWAAGLPDDLSNLRWAYLQLQWLICTCMTQLTCMLH